MRRYFSAATLGLVLMLTLWGGWLRLWRLGETSFWMDEAFSVQAARAIRAHGIPRCENGETVWSWLPQHYLMAGALSALGGSHQAARLPAAVAGTLQIPLLAGLAYLLTRSRSAAALAAFLVVFSVPDIAWSRQARGYLPLQLFGVAALVVHLRAHHRPRPRLHGLATSLLLTLAILTHRAGYVFWLIVAGQRLLEMLPGAKQSADDRPRAWSEGGSLLLPLLAGWLLPSGASQGIGEAVQEIFARTDQTDYAAGYFALIRDFWGWNTLWMLVGFAALLRRDWRRAAPILLGVAAYLLVVSEHTLWFHTRYLLPITPFLHLAVATAPPLAFQAVSSMPWARRRLGTVAVSLMVLWGVTTATQNLRFAPESEYDLGPTEPQADWRGAFAWLRARDAQPVTVMALPVMHDVYLGPRAGKKYFLPFTFSHAPGEWQESAAYTVADPVDADRLQALTGYVILDRFGFLRLKQHAFRVSLARHRPVHVTADGTVRIWRLPLAGGGQEGNAQ